MPRFVRAKTWFFGIILSIRDFFEHRDIQLQPLHAKQKLDFQSLDDKKNFYSFKKYIKKKVTKKMFNQDEGKNVRLETGR